MISSLSNICTGRHHADGGIKCGTGGVLDPADIYGKGIYVKHALLPLVEAEMGQIWAAIEEYAEKSVDTEIIVDTEQRTVYIRTR